MKFQSGQEVVCINDDFPWWAYKLYDQLPIKGHTYTVRNCSMGRSEILDVELESMTPCVTLQEIFNPDDPYYKGGKAELRFKEDRFDLLENVFQKEVLNKESEWIKNEKD